MSNKSAITQKVMTRGGVGEYQAEDYCITSIINTIMKVKKQNTFYESPLVFIEVVSPEEGFAQSPYGETGAAGKTVVTDEYGDF